MITGIPGTRAWMLASYAYGLIVAATVSHFLFDIPIQVYDCFTDVLSLQRPVGELVADTFGQQSFLRPGRYVQAKVVYELADGRLYEAFRLVHVAHVIALVLLFVRLLRPSGPAAFAALAVALAVLIGGHTLTWTLREAFPINHYLTMVVACAAAANLAFARNRWWIDVSAVVLFVAAALTIESGVLVWVVLAGGYLVGLRGVSRTGLTAVTACLVVYFALRFVVLDVGVPGLLDRESAFGFRRYTGAELQTMFGDNPAPFYIYNVAASIAGTLAAEPRDGIFKLTQGIVEQGSARGPLLVTAVATLLATAVVCRYVWIRRRAFLERRLERGDQIVALFWLVLLANAAMGFAYTKDVIMAPAGVFFAAAVFVGVHDLIGRLSESGRPSPGLTLLLVALSCTWAYRAVGTHAALAVTALEVREQWAYVDEWLDRWAPHPLPAHMLQMKRHLQDDAVIHRPLKPPLRDEWRRLFDVE